MAVKKSSALGKGIDAMGINALIPQKTVKKKEDVSRETSDSVTSNEDVSRETSIKTTMIEPNSNQPRKNFNEDALNELAESIKQVGLIQPIVVQKKDKFYEIIAGERRWRAAKIAGLKEVPVIIKDYTPQEIVEVALIENIQREDLNPIEEAQAYHNLIQEYNLKQDEVAERVAKSRVTITNSLRLLKLDERVQRMVIDEMLSSGHARALLTIEDRELQYELAGKIFDSKLSVRETEKLVKRINNEKNTDSTNKNTKTIDANIEAIYKEMEESIKSIYGTKVIINRKDNSKGKIEIEYYSQEELERLYQLLRSVNN